jgi:hypothetical protein
MQNSSKRSHSGSSDLSWLMNNASASSHTHAASSTVATAAASPISKLNHHAIGKERSSALAPDSWIPPPIPVSNNSTQHMYKDISTPT